MLAILEAGAELEVASVKVSSFAGVSVLVGGCPLIRRLRLREIPPSSDVEGSAAPTELERPEPVVRRLVGIGIGREALMLLLVLPPVPVGVDEPLLGEPATMALSRLLSVPVAPEVDELLLPGPVRLVRRASTDWASADDGIPDPARAWRNPGDMSGRNGKVPAIRGLR